MNEKLSPAMTELLAAMRSGVRCHYMRYAGRFNPTPYYFRTDNMKHCTKSAEGLLTRGLVEKVDDDGYGRFQLRATETQRSSYADGSDEKESA